MINLLKELGINVVSIIFLVIIGYFFREGIKNFFLEKFLEKQSEYNDKHYERQCAFQKELMEQNLRLQQILQNELEKQKNDFQKDLKHFDYKREYFKKIIDKRIETYERIVRIINTISMKADYFSKDKKFKMYICFESLRKLRKVNNNLIYILKERLWISPELYKEIVKLNDIIADIIGEIKIQQASGKKYNLYSMGISNYNDMKLIIQNINTICSEDMMNFDDVENFFKECKKNK